MLPRLIYSPPKDWPARLLKQFVQLGPDPAAKEFLRTSRRASLSQTVLHQALCCLPLDDFDINAWLDIYPLHLLTRDQMGKLFSAANVTTPLPKVLDIGAGSGHVTHELKSHCASLTATETSAAMASRLQESGYEVWHEDIAATAQTRAAMGEGNFDLVAVLNVLDRCASPKSMLAAAHMLLAPSPSWLLLATPLPFNGAYYGRQTWWTGRPMESLDLGSKDDNWNTQAVTLIEHVLPSMGFSPMVISRVPYLGGGDAFDDFTECDDVIVLAQKIDLASDSTPGSQ